MIESFRVVRRGPWHWDICDGTRRLFAIRGEPGVFAVRDEREPEDSEFFQTLEECMGFVAGKLMWEDEGFVAVGDYSVALGSDAVSEGQIPVEELVSGKQSRNPDSPVQ